jgi:hypothetical protein
LKTTELQVLLSSAQGSSCLPKRTATVAQNTLKFFPKIPFWSLETSLVFQQQYNNQKTTATQKQQIVCFFIAIQQIVVLLFQTRGGERL